MRFAIEKATDVSQPAERRGATRRLAAILGADISGYSLLMGDNEEATHRRVGAAMDRLVREIEKSYGQVFSFSGDGLMAEFPSAVEALKCALRVQQDAAKRNGKLAREQHIAYRMGIHSGEIVVQQGQAGGNAVNIAARLEQIGEPGGICMSSTVHEQVHRIVTARYDAMGERRLKNIRQPVLVYRIAPEFCKTWATMPALPRAVTTAPGASLGSGDYRASLAVLPLRTLQGDALESYFGEGVVDDIIRLLGGLKELLVISRSATAAFGRGLVDLRRIGHDLDVRYVLHGSVRRAGGKLRIAVELSDAESGEAIWADRFDGEEADIFDLQDRIASRVVAAIAPQVRARELWRATRKHPNNRTAYDLTLQALEQIYRMSRDSFGQARRLLEQATASDPTYALAHTYAAYLGILIIGQGWSRDLLATGAETMAAADIALALDQNDALALALYGHMQSFVRKDFDCAQAFLDRAIVAGPSCPWAWSLNSYTCQYRGVTGEAVTRAERAVRLSPIGPDAWWHEGALAQAHYAVNDFEGAIAWGRMSNAHNAHNLSNMRVLVATYAATGEMEQARLFAQQHRIVAPEFTLGVFRARTPLPGALRDGFVERLRSAGLPD